MGKQSSHLKVCQDLPAGNGCLSEKCRRFCDRCGPSRMLYDEGVVTRRGGIARLGRN